jgi:hypothetical protein
MSVEVVNALPLIEWIKGQLSVLLGDVETACHEVTGHQSFSSPDLDAAHPQSRAHMNRVFLRYDELYPHFQSVGWGKDLSPPMSAEDIEYLTSRT